MREMGAKRTVQTLSRMNKDGGFDCPSCAWPDPDRRHPAEFCENGAKAVAWEATRKRVDRAFFAAHSVAELREQDGHWLEHHGRLTEPMYLAPGATHYAPIGWDEANRLIAERLRALPDPSRAVFYTSGRASNEAAFVYQLLARRLGTNNLPDCSNMCHESSGAALTQTLGVGKGTVHARRHQQRRRPHRAWSGRTQAPTILGCSPRSRRPSERGARIVAINPLPEAGLIGFRNPQTATRHRRHRHQARRPLRRGPRQRRPGLVQRAQPGAAGRGGCRSGHRLRPRLHRRATAAASTRRSPRWRALDWSSIEAQSGLRRDEIEARCRRRARRRAGRACAGRWA